VYLIETFLPMLYDQGLTSQDVEGLLVDNPRSLFLH